MQLSDISTHKTAQVDHRRQACILAHRHDITNECPQVVASRSMPLSDSVGDATQRTHVEVPPELASLCVRFVCLLCASLNAPPSALWRSISTLRTTSTSLPLVRVNVLSKILYEAYDRIGSIALVTYDYFLTLDREIAYVWRAKQSLATLSFYGFRYPALFNITIILFIRLSWPTLQSNRVSICY